WMHTGWSAHGGLIAAQLAGTGFRGPRQALDHRYGLYAAFLGRSDIDLAQVTDSLGETWLGMNAQPKLYPCAHVIQPYIEGALAWRAQGQTADAIATIHCIMAPWAMPIVAEPRHAKIAPRNDLEAIGSLPFMVGAALIDGKVDLATLAPATISRPDIQAFASRIHCEADATLGPGFDGRMNVVRKDGERASRAVGITPPGEALIIDK